MPPTPATSTATAARMASSDTSAVGFRARPVVCFVPSVGPATDEPDERPDEHSEDLGFDLDERIGVGVGMDQLDQQHGEGGEDEQEADDRDDAEHHQIDGGTFPQFQSTNQARAMA